MIETIIWIVMFVILIIAPFLLGKSAEIHSRLLGDYTEYDPKNLLDRKDQVKKFWRYHVIQFILLMILFSFVIYFLIIYLY